jgi:SAM-dependent methyltransferase
MDGWVVITFALMGGVLFIKLLYVLAIILTHKITQGAMFVPSAGIRVNTFLDAVPMNDKSLLVDIGCGDGRVLRAARRRYGVMALGFEVNPLAYFIARIRNLGIKGIQVSRKNFWKVDIGDADVVFCYLFPDVLERLVEKLERELRSGALVISCNFPLPGWRSLKVLFPESSLHNDPIYLYRFPDSCRFPKKEFF